MTKLIPAVVEALASWDKDQADPRQSIHISKDVARPLAEFAREQLGQQVAAPHREGHGALCYYCGAECDLLAGNPARWPIPLCHPDDPGKVKWHHIECVSSRLVENQQAVTTSANSAQVRQQAVAPLIEPSNYADVCECGHPFREHADEACCVIFGCDCLHFTKVEAVQAGAPSSQEVDRLQDHLVAMGAGINIRNTALEEAAVIVDSYANIVGGTVLTTIAATIRAHKTPAKG